MNSVTMAYASSERMQVTPDFSEEDYLESRIDNTVFNWMNPTPFYGYVELTAMGLGIFGNEAECALSVSAYPKVNKISVYLYLQRYVLGKWTTIPGGAFRKEVNSDTLLFYPTKILDTRGSYRFTVQIFAYTNDGSVEVVEHASNTAVY